MQDGSKLGLSLRRLCNVKTTHQDAATPQSGTRVLQHRNCLIVFCCLFLLYSHIVYLVYLKLM